jgi:thioredoxin-dependent peroxiredoxin
MELMALQTGDIAPTFTGINEKGENISLTDYLGKKLILYFYPKDDTPGCTSQACNLRDNYELLLAKGFAIVGISPDEPKKHTKFITKYTLPFSLIADVQQEILQLYGVWGRKKFMGREFDGVLRTTFVIDEAGKIEKIFHKVDTTNHTAQILATYA